MSEESEVVFFESDDPEMAAAAKSARKSFRWFWYQVATDFNRIVPANAMALIFSSRRFSSSGENLP